MATPYLPPFRQGELDGLCGVYAAINAIRLILGANGRKLTSEDWQCLFAELLACADVTVGVAKAATDGIETGPFRKLLKSAAEHLRDEHGIALTSTPLVPRRGQPTFKSLLDRFRETVSPPNQAVILTVEGYISHWTVLYGVTNRYLLLFDSSGYYRLLIANCRMPYEPARPGSRNHIIPPEAAFVVTLCDI